MITKINAVKMSVRKWERVVAMLEAGQTYGVSAMGPCGFCSFFTGKDGNTYCHKCPLYRSANGTIVNMCFRIRGYTLFWDIINHLRSSNYPQALKLSKEMLEQIRILGAEWIKAKK